MHSTVHALSISCWRRSTEPQTTSTLSRRIGGRAWPLLRLLLTQFQAIQLTVFTFLPSILLSGFMFPFDGMPRVAQWIGEVIPLTHFVRLSRGILVRGADLADLHAEIWPLLAFFGVFLALATLRFNKRLD